MILVEAAVLADSPNDPSIFALVDLDGDITLVPQRLDDPLWISGVRKSEHLHEMLVRGHAARGIVELEDLTPHESLVP